MDESNFLSPCKSLHLRHRAKLCPTLCHSTNAQIFVTLQMPTSLAFCMFRTLSPCKSPHYCHLENVHIFDIKHESHFLSPFKWPNVCHSANVHIYVILQMSTSSPSCKFSIFVTLQKSASLTLHMLTSLTSYMYQTHFHPAQVHILSPCKCPHL